MSETNADIDWQWRSFAELDGRALYAVMAARQDVFILEQQCLYPDLDGLDTDAHHLLGWTMANGEPTLAAYLRCLAPGAKYDEMSLGRVLTTQVARGAGLGYALIERGIAHAERQHPGARIRIGAQQHLERFYAGFGFKTISEPYDEDGILHIDMLR